MSSETDRTGTVVGHYRIVERMGGGMDVVYRAEDLKLGRTVALKFLSAELSHDPAALDHAGICAIHDISEVDGVLRSKELQSLRPMLVAGEYARLGEREKTLDWLDRAFRLRDVPRLSLRGDQEFDALRSDPTFQNILRRLNPMQ